MSLQKLKEILEEVSKNPDLSVDEKLKLIDITLCKLLDLKCRMSQREINNSLNTEELSKKSKKMTQNLMSLITEKDTWNEKCKEQFQIMMITKKKWKLLKKDEEGKNEAYNHRYTELVEDIDKEIEFDEEEAKEINEENKKLKERMKVLPKEIEKIDADYRSKLEDLKKEFEDDNLSMKDVYKDIEVNSKIVDTLKDSISSKKSKIMPIKMKINMVNGKLKECKELISKTNLSIKNYELECLKISKKIKKRVEEEKISKSKYDEVKNGMLMVYQENLMLNGKLVEIEKTMKEKKSECSKLFMEFNKLKASRKEKE